MHSIPYIKRQGNRKVLMVQEQPMILIAGEVHNSNASSLTCMESVWEKAERLSLNTLLVPVSWELTEPEEGRFDFSLVDGLITQARQRRKKLVLLWFGTWKNAEGMYAPEWVKVNLSRFRRGQIRKGFNKANRPEMYDLPYTTFSYLCEETCRADAKAFSKLMHHLKEVDEEEHTVVAVQVENETGLLGAAREQSDEADCLFEAEVPGGLTEYLREHAEQMTEDVRDAVLGGAHSGSWKAQYGDVAEELFSAYYIASYVEKVAAAGKEVYPLPLAVNCWLDKGDQPGNYPSGGPVAKMQEVWQYAAPHIDLYCPDIYVPNFLEICEEYDRKSGTLFIPECATHSYAASRLMYCVGHYHAMCYSPFGFEDMGQPFTAIQSFLFGMDVTDPALKTPQDPEEYGTVAGWLSQLMPLITQRYGTGRLQAVCAERKQESSLDFGSFAVDVVYETLLFQSANGACLGIKTAEDSCLLLLKGCGINLRSTEEDRPNLDLLGVEEGTMEAGEWKTIRRLNGDETVFMSFEQPTLLKIRVFLYQ